MLNRTNFKSVIEMFVLFSLLFIFGCSNQQEKLRAQEGDFPTTFEGESKTWEVSGYKVEFSSDSTSIGNGILSMKGTNEYLSDSFSFTVHAIINEEDNVIQTSQISGENVNIAIKDIGTITGSPNIDKDGKFISNTNLGEIYMIIKWNDSQGNMKEERIDLFNKTNKKGK